ncbi:MAG: sigma-54 dependent transcriptional regulator [Treponema sp.]|jgi:two-component system response regulator AtoC|nr:sigma-54 dependent transcriptional regulator [Treponema sp.]
MRILIVDDEKNIRESLKKYLALEGIDSQAAPSAEAALDLLERSPYDAAILDLRLGGMSGQDLLEAILEKGFPVPVIMISAHGQIEDAVRALKTGAKDYLVKPVDPAELVFRLRALVENRRRENVLEAESRSPIFRRAGVNGMIGTSDAMRNLSSQIDKLSLSGVTELITGESGTGKEIAAREIHRRGPNGSEPFAAVNIGGIHESLMESELFGHEKGSFTGAVGRRQGLFELAGSGAIFLDEIGEMSLPLQVKLLRVLQERKIRRLGGITDIPVNARIISATNRNVEALVRKGTFREDLYYRLNVFRISLPPLRERAEDIPPLAEFLLDRLCSRMGRAVPVLEKAALEKLRAYTFPGNVRELENILERALIFCENGRIAEKDIDIHEALTERTPAASESGAAKTPSSEPAGKGESLAEIEKRTIMAALERCGGNRTRAAAELGITRKTILNKLKNYGILPP